MNVPSRSDFSSATMLRDAVSDHGDDRMDQIRELLFGEAQRQNDARFMELTLRLRDLEQLFMRRLEALEARVAAISSEVTAEQRALLAADIPAV